jgi:hypothetical protein
VRPESTVSPVLVAWGNAWLAGHVGLDEAADRVEAAGGPTVAGEVPLRGYLAGLRADGLSEFRLALPAPGDPLGLSGPPEFNSAAVDAGEAVVVVLPDRRLGLVPAPDRRGSSYAGVRLTVYEAGPVRHDLPSLAEAEQELSAVMRSATEALASVEGPAQGRPERLPGGAPGDTGLAPGYPARAHRVASLAARLATVLRLADDRGLTSAQLAARGDALRALDRSVRRATVAAHHAIFEPLRSA